ncbi:MAG: nucleoside deaminase [Parabacteroides sp.]|nr:nucleoside deaminase [Parabacteroides sp.]
MDKNKYMQLAIDLAKDNVKKGFGGPFGAVIVKNGEVIAQAANSVTSTNDPTAHAEVNAIRQACKKLNTFNLSGCEIYASCEPCPMCLSAIYWARIDKVYVAATKKDAAEAGFDDEFIYKELDLPENKRQLRTSELLMEEGQKPFIEWKQKADKITY